MIGNSETLVGTWKLLSCVLEDVETKEQKPAWGANPNGYIVMTPGGRWIVIQTAEGRDPPQNDEDRIAAFKSLLAYSGKYHTEGNKVMIGVDIAADESWNGTEQVRYYKIWVTSGRWRRNKSCPLYPRKRHQMRHVQMSAKGQ
jgi:hypothetical protein